MNLFFHIFIIFSFLLGTGEASAQIIRKAGQMIQNAFEEAKVDSTSHEGSEAAERVLLDSIHLSDLERQLQEMRLNEMLLRAELDNAVNGSQRADSIRKAEQRHRIDSLRAITPGVPVCIEGDTLFLIYAARGGYSANDRAEMISNAILKIGKDRRIRRDSVYMLENDNYIDIMYGNKVILSITDTDALWQGTTRQDMARHYIRILDGKIRYLKNENSFAMILKRA